MSLADFCSCTPEEFEAVWEAWSRQAEQARRESWEQTRMACLCMVQPHSRKRLVATDVFRLPWDGEAGACEEPEPELSREERKARMAATMRACGLTPYASDADAEDAPDYPETQEKDTQHPESHEGMKRGEAGDGPGEIQELSHI